MRILTVCAFFEKHGGGIEIVAAELARALARHGHDSSLAAAALDPVPTDKEVRWVALPARDPLERVAGLPMPLPTTGARRILEEEVRAADAVIIHDALYASSMIAARLVRRHRKPWLLIQHIGEIPYSNPLLRGALMLANAAVTRPMLNKAPQVVFISEVVRRHFADVTFRSPPELRFNGVDSSLFRSPAPGERDKLRSKFGMHSRRPQLLFVGRFVEKKGLAVLREFAALRPDCDLWLVGSGPIDPAGWALPNVNVLGRKPRSELAQLYRACDALVLPSAGEGFPLVIQEALTSGMTVFCGRDSAEADPAGARFLTGIEVDLADPTATARRLDDAVGEAIPEQAVEAAAYAKAHYDWNANATWISARLEQLAAAGVC